MRERKRSIRFGRNETRIERGRDFGRQRKRGQKKKDREKEAKKRKTERKNIYKEKIRERGGRDEKEDTSQLEIKENRKKRKERIHN